MKAFSTSNYMSYYFLIALSSVTYTAETQQHSIKIIQIIDTELHINENEKSCNTRNSVKHN